MVSCTSDAYYKTNYKFFKGSEEFNRENFVIYWYWFIQLDLLLLFLSTFYFSKTTELSALLIITFKSLKCFWFSFDDWRTSFSGFVKMGPICIEKSLFYARDLNMTKRQELLNLHKIVCLFRQISLIKNIKARFVPKSSYCLWFPK